MRTDFLTKMTVKEFKSFFWFKKELEQLCRSLHLPTYGNKYGLIGYLYDFSDGKSIFGISAKRRLVNPIKKNNFAK